MSLLGKKTKQKSDAVESGVTGESPVSTDSAASISTSETEGEPERESEPESVTEPERELSFDEIPEQTDRASYEALWTAAQKRRSVRVRQIRARASNDLLVAGIVVSTRWAIIPLQRIADYGRSYVRQLANDKTIEVHLIED